jgi:predicted transcriptional regulator
MAMHTITLQLDDQLYEELAVAARDRGEDPAQTAQRALAEYLRGYMQHVEAEGGFPQA